MSAMPFEDLEAAYEMLAMAGAQRDTLFLTRLVLLLSHELGDITAFRNAVGAALEGLE